MTARQRGKTWMADFMVAGTRHRQTFDTETDAIAWEVATRSALARGAALPEAGAPRVGGSDTGTLGNLVRRAEIVHWNRKAGSDRSVISAKVFLRWAGEKVPATEALTVERVSEFMEYLIEERGVSDSTLNRYTSAISILNKVAGLPKLGLVWRDTQEGRKRFFTEAEAALIIQTLTVWGLHRERDFFVFLLDTGARPYSEASKMAWADIRDERFVYFGPTKNGNERTLPLTTRAREAIQRQQVDHGDDHGPFSSLRPWDMRSVWERLRAHRPSLKDTVLYTTRHTCASWQVIRGIDIRRIQVWMGHKNISTTLIYAHLSPSHLLDNLRALEGPSASTPPITPMPDTEVTLNREPVPIAPETPKPSQRTSPRNSPWHVAEQLD